MRGLVWVGGCATWKEEGQVVEGRRRASRRDRDKAEVVPEKRAERAVVDGSDCMRKDGAATGKRKYHSSMRERSFLFSGPLDGFAVLHRRNKTKDNEVHHIPTNVMHGK